MMNPSRFLTLIVLFFFIQFSLQPLAHAQDSQYLEDEGQSLWEEQQFLDITGEEFTTEDSQYVGEEDVKAAKEAARRSGIPAIDLAAALERDKELLPDNIMYGIGTGALIGGWFALVEGGDARENVRFLTIGTLVGALLGVAIGNKSLFMGLSASHQLDNPSLPGFRLARQTESGLSIEPVFRIAPHYTELNFQIHF